MQRKIPDKFKQMDEHVKEGGGRKGGITAESNKRKKAVEGNELKAYDTDKETSILGVTEIGIKRFTEGPFKKKYEIKAD